MPPLAIVPDYKAQAERFASHLDRAHRTQEHPGSWSYEFDVQTRWGFYPAGSANLVATCFVARALGTAGLVWGDDARLEAMEACARFLVAELCSAEDLGRVHFRYTPTARPLIHNANVLGAAVVAVCGRLRAHPDWLELATRAAYTTVEAQLEDGSWPYGAEPGLGWCDNFHTAYVLGSLLLVWLATKDERVAAALRRGVAYWTDSFFEGDGSPRYYGGATKGPQEIHSAATAVDVASRLATWGLCDPSLAERVAEWTNRHLLDPATGFTRYQVNRGRTDARHWVRWGDAHWALGLSSLACLQAGTRDPVESRVDRGA